MYTVGNGLVGVYNAASAGQSAGAVGAYYGTGSTQPLYDNVASQADDFNANTNFGVNLAGGVMTMLGGGPSPTDTFVSGGEELANALPSFLLRRQQILDAMNPDGDWSSFSGYPGA
jgi:hypothetical protein